MFKSRLPRRLVFPLACLAAIPLSSCVIGNSGKLVLSRHISVGQELIDLKEARDRGAINDEEYEKVKGKLMEMVESIDMVHTVNDATPGHDEDGD